MRTTSFAALAAFSASFVLAAPKIHFRYVRHERRDESSRWVKRGSVDPRFSLPMRIGLTQSNLDRAYNLLMEVSDPSSPKYGQHYSVDAVNDLFAPSRESVDAVFAWLEEAGIDLNRVSQSTNKQWLQLDLDTGEAEELLQSKFHIFENTVTGKTSIGCDEYYVKESVQHHIDYITPGVKMIEIRSQSGRKSKAPRKTYGPIVSPLPPHTFLSSTSLEYCDTYITPACIMAMYNITSSTTSAAGNELGIFEETPQYVDQSDLDIFFSRVARQIPNGTFPIVKEIDGAKNSKDFVHAGVEAILDFEISYPIIFPQNSMLFSTDAFNFSNQDRGGLFNTFLDAIDGSYCTYSAFGEKGDNNTVDPIYPIPAFKHHLQCGVFKPTNVISFSYELAEFFEGTTPNYQMRQCNEYMKLSLQGVSLVFSSGDAGVASNYGCGVENNHVVFNPNFPSTCPYITSVGATTLIGKADKGNERATTQFPTGGGFSNYFARPSYQESAVEAYFNSSAVPHFPSYTNNIGRGLYNRSGRAYPDVSAIGQAILNFGGGRGYLVGGTSASAPLFAAMLTRINEERLSAKMPTIGFVNPVLYQNPQAFRDITVGHNADPALCGKHGFSAGEGWDPLTGLGTPNYPALLEAFMKKT